MPNHLSPDPEIDIELRDVEELAGAGGAAARGHRIHADGQASFRFGVGRIHGYSRRIDLIGDVNDDPMSVAAAAEIGWGSQDQFTYRRIEVRL